jgi:Na+/serine symporter
VIYHLLGILVFFMFVAALIGCVLFTCVLIDALTIWWGERRGR